MSAASLAQLPASETLLEAMGRILGFSLLAAGTAGTAAFAFRWYSGDEIPEGVAGLIGITTVAIWLNTQTALREAIIGTTPLLDAGTAVYTIAAFAASAIAADGGRRLADRLARDVFSVAAPRTIDEVGQLVRSAGRVVAVELPAEIEDVEGYDPVDEATKAELEGQEFLFPRRLDADQLRDRLRDRLGRDHGIGHVDVEFTDNKTIEYLAVGSRPSGIGPTLAPGTVAVALRADPAPDAGPGDAVEIWRDEGDGARRLTTGELRATAGDVVTLAVGGDDASVTETDAATRLVTRPDIADRERELVSLFRVADETVTKRSVDAGDPLDGESIGSLPVLVLALERAVEAEDERNVIPLPEDDRRIAAGDDVYVLGRPSALRLVADREPEATRQER